MNLNIKRFAKADAWEEYWYQELEKERVTTTEEVFNELYTMWICTNNSSKYDDKVYLIYEFELSKEVIL